MPDLFINKKESTALKSSAVAQPNHTAKLPKLTHVSYVTQDLDESVLMLVRRHPIANISWIATILLLALLPIIFSSLLPGSLSSFLSFLPGRYILIFSLFYYGLLLSFGYINFLTWFYNALIVTDKSIVLVIFSDLVYHQVQEARLAAVQDVKYDQSGPLASIFNFGNLTIQTESREESFHITTIPHPQQTADRIQDLTEGFYES